MEKIIRNLVETMTDEEVREMEQYMEEVGLNLDFLDMPYTNGTYKTEQEKRQNIIEMYINEVMFINEFKGECANEYNGRMDYVECGAFERSYFAYWLDSCSDYPCVNEIIEFCQALDNDIRMWLNAVERGWIDPKEHWGE